MIDIIGTSFSVLFFSTLLFPTLPQKERARETPAIIEQAAMKALACFPRYVCKFLAVCEEASFCTFRKRDGRRMCRWQGKGGGYGRQEGAGRGIGTRVSHAQV